MSRQKYTRADYEQLKELKGQGLVYTEIAERMGMTKGTVTWILNRKNPFPAGLPKAKRPNQKEKTKRSILPRQDSHLFHHDPYYKF